MWHRLLVLLLAPSLFLQTLCVPHSHAGAEPADHDWTPHFHLHGLGGHDHHDPLHQQHDADQHDADGGAGPEAQAGDDRPDHDADAVYGSVSVMLGGRGQRLPASGAASLVPLALAGVAAGPFPARTLLPLAQPPPRWHAPSCPIWLRTLALLI